MPELSALSAEDVRRLAAENYSKGASIFKNGDVRSPWRTSSALHALVEGSAATPYEVSVGPRDDGTYWARCTCPAARRQSLCKHAAALLVAWATKPKGFEVRADPTPAARAEDAPKVESEAKRARQPKADRRSLIGQGLDQAEALLVDLCAQGLLAVTAEQIATMASIAEVVEAHKLRRLARQIVELHHAAEKAQASVPDERVWAGLLSEAWSTLQATRRALEKSDDPDQAALLEDLIGKTWLEKDLRRVEGLRLLELAYESAVLSSGFRIETSYLLDVGANGTGTLYAEKQITPIRLKDTPPKRSYSAPLDVAAAGVYPGVSPARLKLIEFAERQGDGADWDRCLALAETSAGSLRQRHLQATLSPVAPQESYALFRPQVVLARSADLYLVDGEGKALRIDPSRQRCLIGLKGALREGALGAALVRLRFGEAGLVAVALSAIRERGDPRLVRLTA